jgi:hypothetical protein
MRNKIKHTKSIYYTSMSEELLNNIIQYLKQSETHKIYPDFGYSWSIMRPKIINNNINIL